MDLNQFYNDIKDLVTFQFKLGDISISAGKLLLFLLSLFAVFLLAHYVAKFVANKILPLFPLKEKGQRVLKRVVQGLLVFTGLLAIVQWYRIDTAGASGAFKIFTLTFFKLGDTPVSISSILIFFVLLVLVIYLSRVLSSLLVMRGLARINLHPGTRYVLRRLTEYSLVVIGAIIAFQTVGIDLSGLAVIFGLLSVGIGFGLQNITSNFISGLILLFERPITIGDRITVGDTEGDVQEINIRSTTIRTLNNITIIVPNSEFVESRVTNWSHGDLKVRLDIDVGVSYTSDLDAVLAALREVAEEHSKVLSTPEPEVLLMEFGDSSWNMRLRAWIANPQDVYYVRSDINCGIVRKFRERNIEIPYPQRDLHVRSPLPVPLENAAN